MTDIGEIILASASPRRREILAAAGIPFSTRVADIVEDALPHGEEPVDHVRRLAREKALAISADPDVVVLAADTVVVVDHHTLGKPTDAADARRMLSLLSGREHEVVTGICLRHRGGVLTDAERTRVHFVELSNEEIDAYVATGEPLDKAGAYAIQGLASKFIDRVQGCYFNVVGLPVSMVYRHLKAAREGR